MIEIWDNVVDGVVSFWIRLTVNNFILLLHSTIVPKVFAPVEFSNVFRWIEEWRSEFMVIMYKTIPGRKIRCVSTTKSRVNYAINHLNTKKYGYVSQRFIISSLWTYWLHLKLELKSLSAIGVSCLRLKIVTFIFNRAAYLFGV